ncbi:MAG TPA: hypothetical protein EYO82_07110 [Gammaproteobacteria bacterium]|nr:hypothetical protein [Gammaproteobacteria bacterium]
MVVATLIVISGQGHAISERSHVPITISADNNITLGDTNLLRDENGAPVLDDNVNGEKRIGSDHG